MGERVCGQNLAWTPAALQPVAAWTQWFTRLLLSCLYPGAPFERKFLAMLLLEALLTTWNTPDKANRQNFRCAQNAFCHPGCCSIHLHNNLSLVTD